MGLFCRIVFSGRPPADVSRETFMRKEDCRPSRTPPAMFHVKPFSPAPLIPIARASMFHVKHFCGKAIADFAPHPAAPAQSVW